MILDMGILGNSTGVNTCLVLGVALVVALSGCGDSADDGRLDVTATTTQVADLVRNVAGDRATVDGILAPNSDPHEYEPRPSDAAGLAQADVVFRSGGDVDLWLDQISEASGTNAPVISLLDSTSTIPAANGSETDPHWWQDPRNAIAAVGAIRDELDAVDPTDRAAFDANARRYTATLRDLDREIATCINRIPPNERKLVTSHDSLAYYAHRYGLEVIGAAIPAVNTQAQASAGETADLIDVIQRQHVAAIFPEAGISPKLEEAIASQTGATIGGELWADALGPAGSDGATYVGALAANTRTIVSGLTSGEQPCAIDVAG
jgi:zinc/manganese transport system substrate-binding protein